MKSIFNNLMGSFTNAEGGFSARKLSAFAGVTTAVFLSYKHTDASNLLSIVIAWLAFALLCLGIITAEQVIKFKNDKP